MYVLPFGLEQALGAPAPPQSVPASEGQAGACGVCVSVAGGAGSEALVMIPDFVDDGALDCGGLDEFLKQDVMSLDAAIDDPR